MLICLDHTQESELSAIDLSEDGSLVSHLVNFLYTGDYPTSADTSHVEDPSSTADNAKSTSRELDTHAAPETLRRWPAFVGNPLYAAFSARDNNIPRTLTELYHSNIPKVATLEQPPPDYSVDVEMYALADKYDIPALAALAAAKFDHTCTLNWHPTSFLETIPRVYDSTLESNQGLRAVVVEHVRRHSGAFLIEPKLKGKFHALLTAIPELNMALLRAYIARERPAVPGNDKVRHAV